VTIATQRPPAECVGGATLKKPGQLASLQLHRGLAILTLIRLIAELLPAQLKDKNGFKTAECEGCQAAGRCVGE
jgi:hypothetical protein